MDKKLPPLVRKKLQSERKTIESENNLIAEFDFHEQKVNLTYDLNRILQLHLDSLINSSYDGVPFLRSLGVNFYDFLFSLDEFEIREIAERFSNVFANSSLLEFVDLTDFERIDNYTFKLTFLLRLKEQDRIFTIEAILANSGPQILSVK